MRFPIFPPLNMRYYCWVLTDDLIWVQIGEPNGYSGLSYLTNALYKEYGKYKAFHILKATVIMKYEDTTLFK